MGLDVYVMPIWMFKAGDFGSPLERLGVPVMIAGAGPLQELPRRPTFLQRCKARWQTRRLRREIEQEIGHPVHWNDHGTVEYGEQARGLENVRAFARWLDYQDVLPAFDPTLDEDSKKLATVATKLNRPATYPQLVDHDCFSGYYLPTDLDRVVYVEPYLIFGRFPAKKPVGSSIRLLKELERLANVLQVWGEYKWDERDPLAVVKAALSQLHLIARTSCSKNLPIVFYG